MIQRSSTLSPTKLLTVIIFEGGRINFVYKSTKLNLKFAKVKFSVIFFKITNFKILLGACDFL